MCPGAGAEICAGVLPESDRLGLPCRFPFAG